MQSTFRDLNILLLGETGVGKSTWVNSLVNQFNYPTLDDAEEGEMKWIIPTRFTLTNNIYEEIEIKIGADCNEVHRAGQSVTQLPKTYECRYNEATIKIIDTPGIGDTRGIGQDRINMQNILTHISSLDNIDGIWVLLNPNNARLSMIVQFCIKQLLTHLHRDACKNIVFCFTNSRATFYRPGDTLPALRKILSENKDVDIKLNKDTIYCIDNESMRYLAAVKNGIKFDDKQREDCAKSWRTSVTETERLLTHTMKLEPHFVKHTLSLNDARQLILTLSRPLCEMSVLIQTNIDVLKDKKMEFQKLLEHRGQLLEQFYIPMIELKTTKIGCPRVVCTSPRCVKYFTVGNVQKIDYNTHCHIPSSLTGVPSNTVNCAALQYCEVFEGKDQSCSHCGCSWEVHMYITYESSQNKKCVADNNVKLQINSKESAIQITQTQLDTLKSRIQILERERKCVIVASAQLACFLENVAIASYNDVFADYLDHLIEIEKSEVSAGGSQSKLDGLQRIRVEYDGEVAEINKGSAFCCQTRIDIETLVQDLYRLKYFGHQLEEAVMADDISARSADRCSREYSVRNPEEKPNFDTRMPPSSSTSETLTWKAADIHASAAVRYSEQLSVPNPEYNCQFYSGMPSSSPKSETPTRKAAADILYTRAAGRNSGKSSLPYPEENSQFDSRMPSSPPSSETPTRKAADISARAAGRNSEKSCVPNPGDNSQFDSGMPTSSPRSETPTRKAAADLSTGAAGLYSGKSSVPNPVDNGQFDYRMPSSSPSSETQTQKAAADISTGTADQYSGKSSVPNPKDKPQFDTGMLSSSPRSETRSRKKKSTCPSCQIL